VECQKNISEALIKYLILNAIYKKGVIMDSDSENSQSSSDFWQIYRGDLHKENV
jgi:hypothetical protein